LYDILFTFGHFIVIIVKIAIKNVKFIILTTVFSILFLTYSLLYYLLTFKYYFIFFIIIFCQHSIKNKILNFHKFFALHRMSVIPVQYSSKITQFIKEKQQKKKQCKKKNKSTINIQYD
jgi:hypothetical protein